MYQSITCILKHVIDYIQFEKVTHTLMYEIFSLKYIDKYLVYTIVFYVCTIKYVSKTNILVHILLCDYIN